jgi:hypothetical protein
MSISAATPNDQKWIQKQIDEVKQQFGEDIVKIWYDLGADWVGDPAIHFRILLPDAVANDDDRLGDVGRRVRDELVDKLGLPKADRFPYFTFRSQSEQAELKDPEWD